MMMKLVFNKAIASLTYHPASILGIEAGQLKIGAAADICIIDPNAHYECQPTTLYQCRQEQSFCRFGYLIIKCATLCLKVPSFLIK